MSAHHLSRRKFIQSAGVGSLVLLQACNRADNGSSGSTAQSRPPIEEEPDVIHVFDWAGYDAKQIYRPYLKEGYKPPKFTFLESDDQALAKIRGGFQPDMTHPGTYSLQDFVNAELLQPFDTSLLSNWSAVDPKMAAQGEIDGEQFQIPADWGYSAPLYRADKVQPEEDSWSLFFDERYDGKISWWDSDVNLSIAGMVQGVSNPWDMTDDELEEAKSFLIEKKKFVRNFWTSETDMQADFAAGNIWITYAWPSTTIAMTNEGLDVVYMEPKESRLSWVAGFVLLKDTDNYYRSHEYADAWIAPESGLWFMNNYGYGHSNIEVPTDKLDPIVVEAFSFNDPSVFERTQFIEWTPRGDVYARMWDEVKAA